MSKKVLPICELSFSCKLAADREQPNEDAEDHHCDLEHSSFCLRCNTWKKKDVTMPAQLENTKGVTKEATKQPRGSLAPKASGFLIQLMATPTNRCGGTCLASKTSI
jgi:hypothetical protein